MHEGTHSRLAGLGRGSLVLLIETITIIERARMICMSGFTNNCNNLIIIVIIIISNLLYQHLILIWIQLQLLIHYFFHYDDLLAGWLYSAQFWWRLSDINRHYAHDLTSQFVIRSIIIINIHTLIIICVVAVAADELDTMMMMMVDDDNYAVRLVTSETYIQPVRLITISNHIWHVCQ